MRYRIYERNKDGSKRLVARRWTEAGAIAYVVLRICRQKWRADEGVLIERHRKLLWLIEPAYGGGLPESTWWLSGAICRCDVENFERNL